MVVWSRFIFKIYVKVHFTLSGFVSDFLCVLNQCWRQSFAIKRIYSVIQGRQKKNSLKGTWKSFALQKVKLLFPSLEFVWERRPLIFSRTFSAWYGNPKAQILSSFPIIFLVEFIHWNLIPPASCWSMNSCPSYVLYPCSILKFCNTVNRLSSILPVTCELTHVLYSIQGRHIYW